MIDKVVLDGEEVDADKPGYSKYMGDPKFFAIYNSNIYMKREDGSYDLIKEGLEIKVIGKIRRDKSERSR
jgi:hypothetical protein